MRSPSRAQLLSGLGSFTQRTDLCISEQARDGCPPLPGTHRAGPMRETSSWLSGLGAQGWAFGKEGPG